MARGNRTYTRDSRGRFASGGGGGAKSSGGSLSARRSLRQSRAKLAAKDPADRSIKGQLSQRSQKGAVTRANKRLIEAKKASQRRMPAQARSSRINAPAGFKKGQGVKRRKQVGGEQPKPSAPAHKQAPKPSGTVYRTRSRAAAAQRERNRQLVEFFHGASRYPHELSHGVRIKSTYVDQQNFLTGKTDRVKVRSAHIRTKSLIGQSQASKRTEKRRGRAEARYEQLLQERKAILARGRVKSGVLARNSQRMSTITRAFREYDMGTGRRTPRYSSQKDQWRRSSYGPQG